MKIKLIAAILLGFAALTSCKKDKTPANENVTVYVAGMQRDSATGADRAGYWKDGTFTANQLATTSVYNNYAHAIAVNGTDVYTTGYENRPGRWQCLVWKNGSFQYTLGDVYGYGNAISVVGSDVHVGGLLYEAPDHYATIWKNQTPSILGTFSTWTSEVLGSAVSGTDVYMVGYIGNTGKLWKNGTDMNLANATGTKPKAITVAGSDVYIAGNINNTTIRYWKNSNYTDITVPAGRMIIATGIAVENSDVYVCGWEYNGTVATAKYWKNGTEVILGDGVRHSRANGIAVKNNTVYVAGDESGSATSFVEYATIWENGLRNTIGKRNSRAMAIAVK
jgi:hypothetical protein